METKRENQGSRLADMTAIGVMGVGCAMLVAGMIIPPPGEIDSSLLVAFGEISTFVGTIFGRRTDKSVK